MKITYFSDDYAHEVMGTKRSIMEEARRQGHIVLYRDKSEIRYLLSIIKNEKPDQVWLAHSDLKIPLATKESIKIPIIGFGFSDPYYFESSRLRSYTAYVTNHYESLLKYGNEMPMHYNPTACDFSFHGPDDKVKRDIDISCIGVGIHPRFKHDQERLVIIDMLRRQELNYNVKCYGKKWNKHPDNYGPIVGCEFLKVIRRSHLGLDLQDDWSPLAHRMFEYLACGTPIITRDRPEVERVFEPGKEILTYTDHKDLFDKIEYYMTKGYDEMRDITTAGFERCKKEHNITYRVKALLSFTESL